MRAQEKNIKGFSLLEIVVVVAILGIITAVAMPAFSDWRAERKARTAVVKIKSAMESINSHVQRGLYSFVQVHIIPNDNTITIITKGMKPNTLANKVNNGTSSWNTTPTTRCDLNDDYWDDVGGEAETVEVRKMEIKDVASNITADGAICFAKNPRWYSGNGSFLSGTGDDVAVDERVFVCARTGGTTRCEVDEGTGVPTDEDHANLFSVDWTRFGEVTMDKWSPALKDWILQ